MKVAYVDSSVFLAILFAEPGYERVASQTRKFRHSFSSNLLEAEVRAVMAREAVEIPSPFELLERINWVHPDRPLSDEFGTVLSAGHLRGADLSHVACALYLQRELGSLAFLSLDERQLEVAGRVGLTATGARASG